MSNELYRKLILKYFGEISVEVFNKIYVKGRITLKEIFSLLEGVHSISKISLIISKLIRHEIVKFNDHKPTQYFIEEKNIIKLCRFPFYLKCARYYYGKHAEDILIDLMLNGSLLISETVANSCLSTEGIDLKKSSHIMNCLRSLIEYHVVVARDENQNKLLKTVNLDDLDLSLFSKGKFHKPQFEWDIMIKLNYKSLDMQIRDRLICQAVGDCIDPTANDIMSKIMCLLSSKVDVTSDEETSVVTQEELFKSFKKPPKFLNSYIDLLVNHEMKFLQISSVLGGRSFTSPFPVVIKNLLLKQMQSVIKTQFKIEGLRIFNTVLSNGFMTYSEIERNVLLPQKNFKQTLPRLVSSGYISVLELSRSKEYTSETIVNNYFIDLDKSFKNMLDCAQTSLFRIYIRREKVFDDVRKLVAQRYNVERQLQYHHNQVKTLKEIHGTSEDKKEALESHEESIQSLSLSINPAEQVELSNNLARLNKLFVCEWEIQKTILLCDFYFNKV